MVAVPAVDRIDTWNAPVETNPGTVTVEGTVAIAVLLLASDGLHGVLSTEALQSGLQAQTTPGAIAEHLVRQAVASGATDNVTALVVRVRR